MENKKKQKIFFIGIGGKGINGIAKVCLEKGHKVSGVDRIKKPETESLEESGAKIFYKHSGNNLDKDTDIVVYTSVAKNTPEIQAAKKYGIRIIKRSSFLKELTTSDFRICIAGSHGKSTTTALLGLSTINSGVDTTIYGGAYTKEFNGYNHFGKSKYSIIEACEYDRSFHDLIGNHTVITSMEKSHLEYYRDEDEMIASFKYFIDQHSADSKLFFNGDNVVIHKISSDYKGQKVTFGFSPRNDYFISDISMDKYSSTFSVFHLGEKIAGDLEINIPGNYNILNFVATIAVMNELEMPLDGIFKTARTFMGVGRRFEITKNKCGQTFIDDFAHHPTQVKYLFDGIRQFYPKQKVCAVFQPRQFNMMRNFIEEYGQAFDQADEIIVTDILPALGDTEDDIRSVNSNDLIRSISKHSHKPVRLINSFPEIVNYIKENYDNQSVVTTIGAGDIYKVRDSLMS